MMKNGPSSSSGGDQSNADHVSNGSCEDDDDNEEDDVCNEDDDFDDIEDSKPTPLPITTALTMSETSPPDSWHHGNIGGGGRLPAESPRPGSQSMHMPMSHQLGYQQQQQQSQSAVQRRHLDDTSPGSTYNNRNSSDSIQTSGMQHCAGGGWLPGASLGAGHFQQHPFYGNDFAPTSGYGTSPPTPHQALFPPYSWYQMPSGPVPPSVAAQHTLLT